MELSQDEQIKLTKALKLKELDRRKKEYERAKRKRKASESK